MDGPGATEHTTHTTTSRPVVLVTDERGDGAAPSGDDPDDPPSPAPAELDLDRWSRLAHDVLVAEHLGPMQVAIAFVDEATIAELKQEHLDGDGQATDVLAFPIDDPVRDDVPPTPEPLILGDIVICPAVAAAQAADHAGSFDDEMALLVVHGLLHLVGMDHAEPDARRAMQARERELLAAHHGPLAGDPWGSGAQA